jgi:opacity protein-like surface antigen
MRYVRAFLLLCLFASGTAALAEDYPKAEVFGGYSFLNIDTNGLTSRQNLNGWEAAVSGNFNRFYAAEFDVSGYYKNYGVDLSSLGLGTLNVKVDDYAFLGGPRWNVRPTFFHILLGGDHLTGSALGFSRSQNGFAGAFGGGVEAKVSGNWSVRASADYLFSRHNIFGGRPYTQNNFRVGVGIAYSFGGVARTVQSPAPTTTASMPIPALGLRAGTRDNGAEVLAIEPSGVAALAGLHVTDVINKVDGKPISTAMELAAELSNHASGSQVRLGYMFRSSALGYFQKETIVILGPLSK